MAAVSTFGVKHPEQELSREWRSWIAENLMLGSHPSALMPVLQQAGIAEPLARREIELALQSPYLAGAVRLSNRLAKRDWVIDIQRKLNQLRDPEIPRRDKLSGGIPRRVTTPPTSPSSHGMMADWPAMANGVPPFPRITRSAKWMQFGREATIVRNEHLGPQAHMAFGEMRAWSRAAARPTISI